jgi:3-dehydroquinate dehydratase
LTTPQPQTQTVTSQNVNEGSLNQMNQVDKIKFLKELAELKNQGIITDAEFQSEKSKIFKL